MELSKQNTNDFKFNRVTIENIINASKKLKKKVNKSDILNANIWYDAMDYIGHFYNKIINESLEGGIFPEVWKTSTIHSIPKINKTKNACEFRPINTIK